MYDVKMSERLADHEKDGVVVQHVLRSSKHNHHARRPPTHLAAYLVAMLALVASVLSFGLTIAHGRSLPTHAITHRHSKNDAMNTSTAIPGAPASFASSFNPLAIARPAGGEVLECGGNMQEALAKGCKYDAMIPAWVPAPCFNESLYEEFLMRSVGRWKWYRDMDGLRETTLELVRTGRYLYLFTSPVYHYHHCIYTWRKQILSMQPGGAWIEDYFMDTEHGDHCTRVMTSGHPGANESTNVLKQDWLTCRYWNMTYSG